MPSIARPGNDGEAFEAKPGTLGEATWTPLHHDDLTQRRETLPGERQRGKTEMRDQEDGEWTHGSMECCRNDVRLRLAQATKSFFV